VTGMSELNKSEVIAKLKKSERTIFRYIEQGILNPVLINGELRFRASEVEALEKVKTNVTIKESLESLDQKTKTTEIPCDNNLIKRLDQLEHEIKLMKIELTSINLILKRRK
jgi:predicted site-specific integrase-resolvase